MTALSHSFPPGGSGIEAAESSLASVPDSTSADPSDINELLADIQSGRYRPSAHSFGELLLRKDRCGWYSRRSIAAFARFALREQGIWWLMVLDSHPDTLTGDEVAYAAATWRVWVSEGRRAFGGARR